MDDTFINTCRKIWDQRAIVNVLKEKLGDESKKLEELKATALKQMEALGLTKQHISGLGTIYAQTKFSVRTPKTPEDKTALFEYITNTKGADVLLAMLSVNSNTLNSFHEEEFELAKERGDFKWRLPGCSDPEIYRTLNMRKD